MTAADSLERKCKLVAGLARRELQATGETARKRTVDMRDVLTVQEAQAARLAAEGRTLEAHRTLGRTA